MNDHTTPSTYSFLIVGSSNQQFERLHNAIRDDVVFHLSRIAREGSFNDISAISEELTVLVVDLASGGSSDIEQSDLQASVSKLRKQNPNKVILSAAVCNDHDYIMQKAAVGSGFDVIVGDENLKLGLISLFGTLRRVREISHPLDPIMLSSGLNDVRFRRWTIQPRDRCVVPDGEEVEALSKAEWAFFFHVIRRDILKLKMDEAAEKAFQNTPSKAALVFKIKRKIGQDFPLIAIDGTYRIAVTS